MKITIKGSPKELAELAKALNGGEIAAEKRADIPPLLTELSNVEETVKNNREVIAALREMHKVAKQDKENAPQAETAEQKIKDFANTLQGCLAQASKKTRSNEEDDKINELAEAIRNADKENAPQAGATEQGLPFIPFLVRDPSNRGHRKRIKQTSYESDNQTNDND